MSSGEAPNLSNIALEKALAIAAYGESVAAYRYRTLADKAAAEDQRRLFEDMADEEHGHHVSIASLLQSDFPGSDFVLSTADKELVIAGPRMIGVTDEKCFSEALVTIYQSELRTGRFYAALRDKGRRPDLAPLLKEMAEECFEHAERVKSMVPREGGV